MKYQEILLTFGKNQELGKIICGKIQPTPFYSLQLNLIEASLWVDAAKRMGLQLSIEVCHISTGGACLTG